MTMTPHRQAPAKTDRSSLVSPPSPFRGGPRHALRPSSVATVFGRIPLGATATVTETGATELGPPWA